MEAWVKEGGSFLFLTDHYPYGRGRPAAGQAVRRGDEPGPDNRCPEFDPGDPARLIFTRENGLLGDHPILWGRGSSEQINRVVTYSGQSLVGPRGSVPLLLLADTAIDRSMQDNAMVSAAGRCQGLAFVHGKGRVVVLGEAGVLSAQFMANGQPFGMNDPGNDSRQLSLNIMHWLSGPTTVNPRTAKKAAASRRAAASRKAGRGTPKPAKAQEPQADPPVNNP